MLKVEAASWGFFVCTIDMYIIIIMQTCMFIFIPHGLGWLGGYGEAVLNGN